MKELRSALLEVQTRALHEFSKENRMPPQQTLLTWTHRCLELTEKVSVVEEWRENGEEDLKQKRTETDETEEREESGVQREREKRDRARSRRLSEHNCTACVVVVLYLCFCATQFFFQWYGTGRGNISALYEWLIESSCYTGEQGNSPTATAITIW